MVERILDRGWLKLIKNKKGSVLLTSYLVITSLLILGAAFLLLSTNESKTAEYQRRIVAALYIAEAGIERALYDLRQDIINDSSSPSWSDGDINGWKVDITELDSDGFFAFPHPDEETYPENEDYPATILNGGYYFVRLKNVSGSDDIWIRSTGVIGGTNQTIEVYASMINIAPWNNAIFGGAGSSGTMVNGNVNIYGSVHILGNGLADGDDAINLGGSAELVGNNYNVGMQGLHQDLKDLIPDLPQTEFNGETVDTLNAELRVKKGVVTLDGNSTVGQEDITGGNPPVKETVDGAYVTDGYGGKGEDSVYSDNGTSEAYDLGNAVSFPTLSAPVGTYTDYYDFFTQTGYTPSVGEKVILADITLDTANFEYGATSDCIADVNCIKYTAPPDPSAPGAKGTLELKGKIYINGGTLGISGGDYEYTGSGTILVSGDVTIDATLVTPTKTKATFPIDEDTGDRNIIGIMTPGDMDIGGTSQEDVMGLFFAEGKISTNMQTDLIGTIITNFFDITNQVPSIFQVPEVLNNLPPGIIADENIWFMKVVYWKKI